jgi:hypothetical protein
MGKGVGGMTKEDPGTQRVRIITKAWADDAFKNKLLSDPAATLRAEGVEVPTGLDVRVLEDTAEVVHYVLPRRPGELSDVELDGVAGGASSSGTGSKPTRLTTMPRATGTPSPGSTQMDIDPALLEYLLKPNVGC